jgi:hypothetical protein
VGWTVTDKNKADEFDELLDSALKQSARDPVPSKKFRDAIMQKIQTEQQAEQQIVQSVQEPQLDRELQRNKELQLSKKESWQYRLKKFLFRPHTIEWNMATSLASAAMLVIVFLGYGTIGNEHDLSESKRSNIVNVRFMYQSGDAKHIALSGNFTQWQPAYSLQKNSTGEWFIDVPLKPGRYEYQFVIDGKQWLADPNSIQYQDDGFGGKNSIIVVSETTQQGESQHAI